MEISENQKEQAMQNARKSRHGKIKGVSYNGCPVPPPHQSLHPIHQRHITVPTSIPQQQVFALAEPKRKPSLFWHTFNKLTPFKKWEAKDLEGHRHGGTLTPEKDLGDMVKLIWAQWISSYGGKTLSSLEPEIQPLARQRIKFLKRALKSMLPSASIADEEHSPFWQRQLAVTLKQQYLISVS